jgi:hypothetical protein
MPYKNCSSLRFSGWWLFILWSSKSWHHVGWWMGTNGLGEQGQYVPLKQWYSPTVS